MHTMMMTLPRQFAYLFLLALPIACVVDGDA